MSEASTGRPCAWPRTTSWDAVADRKGRARTSWPASSVASASAGTWPSRMSTRPASAGSDARPAMTSRPTPPISPATVSVTSGTDRMARRRTSIPWCSRMRPRASNRVGPGRWPGATGAPAGRCGGRSATDTRRAPRSRATRAWSAPCTRTESTRAKSIDMSRPSPTGDSCGRTSWHTTTDCGRGPGAPGTAPAARSSTRCAGTTAGLTWTTRMTSTSRRRRPARTQVSGRAQLSARIVRGKGGTSGWPSGADASAWCSPEGWRCAHETSVTSCPASASWRASTVVCAATPPWCGWVGPTMAMRSAADPVGSADPAALSRWRAPAAPADRWPRTGEPCGNASVMVLRL